MTRQALRRRPIVGAWSWDEQFPDTARGWTHTSAWVKLRLTSPPCSHPRSFEPGGALAVPMNLSGWRQNSISVVHAVPRLGHRCGSDLQSGRHHAYDQDHTFNRGNIGWAGRDVQIT